MPEASEEIPIAIIAAIGMFLVLTSIVIYLLSFYHKRKIAHRQQIIELEQQFNETLLTSQLEIQENNFRHVSREIHDSVGQLLTLVKIQLNIISQSDHITKAMVENVKENVAMVMAELRDISKGLNSERVQISNLYDIVVVEINRINRNTQVKGSANLVGTEKELDKHKKLILFRIIQECLQNIIKHSKAKTFCILLKYLTGSLQICIEDDGAGFDAAAALREHSGMGLANIQLRSALIGGTALIESKPGRGTAISIMIPYE